MLQRARHEDWLAGRCNRGGLVKALPALPGPCRPRPLPELCALGSAPQEDGQWIQFDDDKMIPRKEEEVTGLSGGGDWHMAYMLLYRAQRVPRLEGAAAEGGSA